MTEAMEKLGNGFIDFMSWFFSDFLGGVNNFLFDTSLSGGINTMIDGVNNSLHLVGQDYVLGAQVIPITHITATNLTIIVSITLFLGVGVALFMIIKNVLFNWA